MDLDRPVGRSVRIECPHCGHVDHDDLELFDDDRLQQLHCSGCGREFFVDVMECPECGSERLFSWMSRPADSALAPLACARCIGRGKHCDEAPGPALDLLG